MSPYSVGSLVKARDREWVVLPDSVEEFLVLQPVSGYDRETAGVLTTLESVEPAEFPLPDLTRLGNVEDWRLLRDAVRFGFRSSIGPFRSLARIAVAPRAYQLVPLMMALKLDPVRLLIADDVGIGKTVEALLVARELLDQGDVRRLAVLCSPALAEQWQREMREKFHIEAELVLPSTASALERRCRFDQSLFERYPYVVVSTEFIKAERRRNEFLDQAPELVIIDEAHGCAGVGSGVAETQRFELVSGLAADAQRHMLLLTATPHSGKSESFRNLLSFLDYRFSDLPDDLSGETNLSIRRDLARYFVQRRRADIEIYVGEETPFPDRLVAEDTYRLSKEYKAFLHRVIRYSRETVLDEQGKKRKRVRWWAVLGLLRSLASSPAAAAATLKNRSAAMEADTAEEADELGRSAVLDLDENDAVEGFDVVPGSDTADLEEDSAKARRYFRDLARDAEKLAGPAKDAKLGKLIHMVCELNAAGYNPIVFCRFIPTAEYVAEHLRAALGKNVTVEAVSGALPPEERQARVAELGAVEGPRVLVATDCLSEGVNLQDHFNAVVHYDLSWNPTRHEQREGRVDRYGQPSKVVRAITYYGADNGIDQVVLDVLLRKHAAIRKATGVSVPVPGESDGLVEALMKGVILHSDFMVEQLTLEGLEEEDRSALHLEWERAADREKKSRHLFAQHGIKAEDVQREVERVRAGLGSERDLDFFLLTALPMLGALVAGGNGRLEIDLADAPRDLVEATPRRSPIFTARTSLPTVDGEVYLTRTHAFVETVAGLVLDAALRPDEDRSVARCGASRMTGVARPTAVFLVRHRILLTTIEDGAEHPALAEHCEFLAVDNLGAQPEWMADDEVEHLLEDGRLISLTEGGDRVLKETFDRIDLVRGRLDERTEAVAAMLLADHLRVREASKRTGIRYKAGPASTPDILGVYALLPGGEV
ncbi:MAG: helicase-related protein [Thermoleophilia bacterium]